MSWYYVTLMCTRRLTLIARTRTAVKVNYGSESELTLTLTNCFNFSLSLSRPILSIHTDSAISSSYLENLAVWHGATTKIFEETAKHKPILGTSIGRTPIRVDKMGGNIGIDTIRKRRHRISKSFTNKTTISRVIWTSIRGRNNRWNGSPKEKPRGTYQEKRVGWENHVIKTREKGVLCNSFIWDEGDAKVRSYLFLCLSAEGQRQIQQKRPNLQLHTITAQEFMTVFLVEIFVTTRIIAFERYTFICRKQKKAESLEHFHADLVELASRADCDDRESEWVRDMFTAHMNNEKNCRRIAGTNT